MNSQLDFTLFLCTKLLLLLLLNNSMRVAPNLDKEKFVEVSSETLVVMRTVIIP